MKHLTYQIFISDDIFEFFYEKKKETGKVTTMKV